MVTGDEGSAERARRWSELEDLAHLVGASAASSGSAPPSDDLAALTKFFDGVCVAAYRRARASSVWERLRSLAKSLELDEPAAALGLLARGAARGYVEASLTLAERGRSKPIRTGYGCPWDIGSTHDGKPILNDARLVLLSGESLCAGESARVALVPLVPDSWLGLSVGSTIRPWESGFIGIAEVSCRVLPEGAQLKAEEAAERRRSR